MYFFHAGNQMQESLSQERLLKETSDNSDPALCSGTSGISALSSLCTAYASDSEDDKPSGTNLEFSVPILTLLLPRVILVCHTILINVGLENLVQEPLIIP